MKSLYLFLSILFSVCSNAQDSYRFEARCFVSLCKNLNGCGSFESEQVDSCIAKLQNQLQRYKCSSDVVDKGDNHSAFRKISFSSTCEVLSKHPKDSCPSGTEAKNLNQDLKACISAKQTKSGASTSSK
jgi:hypothetical protein